jgi:hypothetical protein
MLGARQASQIGSPETMLRRLSALEILIQPGEGRVWEQLYRILAFRTMRSELRFRFGTPQRLKKYILYAPKRTALQPLLNKCFEFRFSDLNCHVHSLRIPANLLPRSALAPHCSNQVNAKLQKSANPLWDKKSSPDAYRMVNRPGSPSRGIFFEKQHDNYFGRHDLYHILDAYVKKVYRATCGIAALPCDERSSFLSHGVQHVIEWDGRENNGVIG